MGNGFYWTFYLVFIEIIVFFSENNFLFWSANWKEQIKFLFYSSVVALGVETDTFSEPCCYRSYINNWLALKYWKVKLIPERVPSGSVVKCRLCDREVFDLSLDT